MNRIAMLLALNEDFADAYRRGEKWALDRVQAVGELDNPTRRFPERDQIPVGEKRNWCGSCPFRDGCMVCDLPYDPGMKGLIGTIVTYRIECKECGFHYETDAVGQEEAESNYFANRLHVRRSPDCRARRLQAHVISS